MNFEQEFESLRKKIIDSGLQGQWVPWSVVTVTSAYTWGPFVTVVEADATGGTFAVTIPHALDRLSTTPIVVKRINAGGNAVTIAAQTNETIDGAATVSLASQYAAKMLVSDGAKWLVVASV